MREGGEMGNGNDIRWKFIIASKFVVIAFDEYLQLIIIIIF